MSEKKRLNVSFPLDVYAEVEAISKEYGISQSQAAIMLTKLGAGAFLRAFHPEKVFSPDEWAEIVSRTVEKDKNQVEREVKK